MTDFEKFDLPNARVLREELQQVLDDFGQSYGLRVQLGNAYVSDGEVRYSNVSVTIPAAIAVQHDKELDLYMRINGLTSKVSKDGTKTLLRYDRRKKKMPWIYDDMGRQMKCTKETAKRYFGAPIVVS